LSKEVFNKCIYVEKVFETKLACWYGIY